MGRLYDMRGRELLTGFGWETLKKLLENCRHRWEHNVTMNLKEMEYEVVHWNYLA